MPRRTHARVDDLVSTKEAAEILSRTHGRPISESFVRRLSYEGRLTKVPLDGRTPRYIRKEVEALRLRDQRGRPAHKQQPAPDMQPEPPTPTVTDEGS